MSNWYLDNIDSDNWGYKKYKPTKDQQAVIDDIETYLNIEFMEDTFEGTWDFINKYLPELNEVKNRGRR